MVNVCPPPQKVTLYAPVLTPSYPFLPPPLLTVIVLSLHIGLPFLEFCVIEILPDSQHNDFEVHPGCCVL